MDNQVTHTADKTPEEIEREMEQTRESLTEKVAALEHQVVGSVQTAADTISHTVDAVKSLVTEAPAAVSDSVKQAVAVVRDSLDFTGHVRKHPWASVGVSAGLGFLVGLLVFRGRDQAVYERGAAERMEEPDVEPAPIASAAGAPAEPRKPGVVDEFIDMIGRKAKQLAETTLDSVSQSLQATIRDEVPKFVHDAAGRLTGSEPPPPESYEPTAPPTRGNGRVSV